MSWFGKDRLPIVATSNARQSFLHRCTNCGSYWESNAHHAELVEKETAAKYFPEVDFSGA